jgi:O-antigen/teichoic acid export membrane protein
MPTTFDNNKRIAKNSILLYVRMLFTMWFNLWATRLLLANLGVDDMGVYGVVGSIVSLFVVLMAGVTSAIQRYITFELGRQDGQPGRVFCTSVNVVIGIAVILIVILEIVGIFFLEQIINVPPNRLNAVSWVYQLSVITAIVNLISIPYNAVVIAHERMDAYAAISILQVLMNWGAAFCLSWIAKDERLVFYAILLTVAGVIIRVIYQFYCTVKFPESHYHFIFDYKLIKQIGKFTGISTISNIIQSVAAQGIILVINWTFGVGINAVYQIALQLKNSVLSFGMNIFKAISPQITKTYADGDMQRHEKLVYSGSKIEVYMILLIMIPFIFRADYIMHLWLGNVPEYATSFCICSICLSLTYAGFEPIRTAVLATNRIFKFMIIPDSVYLVTVLGFSYLVAKLLGEPLLMMITVVALDVFSCFLRVWYAKKVSFLRIRPLLKHVLWPIIKVTSISSIICFTLSLITSENIAGVLLLLIINSVSMSVIIYWLGINDSERDIVKSILFKLKSKI